MSNISVERALILLRYIVDNENGLSIREVSRKFGYNPATVQKIVNALKAQGFIVQDGLTERYHLGPEAIQFGLAALSQLDVRRVARPYLKKLSCESGETTFLAIVRGDCAVYVDKFVSEHPIRMDAPLGVDRPFNCTAVGKTLLSGLPEERIEELAKNGAFIQMTERSISNSTQLKEEIEQVQKNGWARDDGEYSSGAGCVASPVYDHEGHIIAAITVTGPSDRIEDDLDNIINLVKSSAAEISKGMGYRTSRESA